MFRCEGSQTSHFFRFTSLNRSTYLTFCIINIIRISLGRPVTGLLLIWCPRLHQRYHRTLIELHDESPGTPDSKSDTQSRLLQIFRGYNTDCPFMHDFVLLFNEYEIIQLQPNVFLFVL